MKKNITFLCGIITVMLAISSCKKSENEGSGTKAVFSYVADGYNVNFTNFSTNSTEYSWDFGDGSNETSTKKSPQHIFKSKGNFLVSLTSKQGSATSTFIDTVSIIGPNIKIDGDFTDWQYVEYSVENAGTTGGSLTAVKTFASSTDIFFYVEGTPDMKFAIIDLYLDADNNTATGFSTWQYPLGSGADFLIEGSLVGGWGDVFTHSGAPTDFSFTPLYSLPDVMNYSAIKTAGGKNIIEFSIKKNKLGTTKNFINYAIIESTSGYAQTGSIPVNMTASSKFGKVAL